MSSFQVQVASVLVVDEQPLSTNEINTFVKNNGTSTDFSIHEVCVEKSQLFNIDVKLSSVCEVLSMQHEVKQKRNFN